MLKQSGAMTRAGAPTQGDAPAPQRTERPKSLKSNASDKLSNPMLDNHNNGNFSYLFSLIIIINIYTRTYTYMDKRTYTLYVHVYE